MCLTVPPQIKHAMKEKEDQEGLSRHAVLLLLTLALFIIGSLLVAWELVINPYLQAAASGQSSM
jgi:hypothetical protein